MLTDPGVLADPEPSELGSDLILVRTVRALRLGWAMTEGPLSGEPWKRMRVSLLEVDMRLGSASPA